MNREKVLSILIFLCFGLLILGFRFYTLYYSFCDWDEASLMSEAWAMTQGQVLYKDIYHIHPFIQFFIFIPFFWILPVTKVALAVKIFNLVCILFGSFLVFKILDSVFKKPYDAYSGALLYINYICGFFWSESSYGEFYSLLPVLGITYLLLKKQMSAKKLFWIGFLSMTSILIKQTSIFDVFFLLSMSFLWRKDMRSKNNALNLIKGSGLCFALCFSYAFFYGALIESFQSIFFHNIHSYTASNSSTFLLKIPALLVEGFHVFSTLIQEIKTQTLLTRAALLMILSLGLSLIFFKNKKLNQGRKLALLVISGSLIWMLCVCFGLAMIGRFYFHYLVQLVIPLSFFLSGFMMLNSTQVNRIVFYIIFVYAIFYCLKNMESHVKLIEKGIQRSNKSKEISQFVQSRTTGKDMIFLYREMNLDIHYLSKRLSPNGIYMHTDMDQAHTLDPENEKKNREKLKKNLPKIIVKGVQGYKPGSTAELFFHQLINDHYRLMTTIKGSEIYERI